MEDEGKEWRRNAAAVEEHAEARRRAEETAAMVAKERGMAAASLQKEMTLDVSQHPAHSGLKPKMVALVEEMYRDGLCVLESGIIGSGPTGTVASGTTDVDEEFVELAGLARRIVAHLNQLYPRRTQP